MNLKSYLLHTIISSYFFINCEYNILCINCVNEKPIYSDREIKKDNQNNVS